MLPKLTSCLACMLAALSATAQARIEIELPPEPLSDPVESRRNVTAVGQGAALLTVPCSQEQQRGLEVEAKGGGGQVRPQGAGVERGRGKKVEKKEGDLPSDAQTTAAPGRQHPVRAKLIELIQQKHARAEQQIGRARTLLNEGKLDEAGAALEAALRSQEEARDGLELIDNLPSRLRQYASVIEDLSVIKVRILRARPSFPEAKEASFRVAALLTDLFFPGWRLSQVIEAKILAAHTVGSRFASRTVMGRRFPSRKRRDLRPGQTLELRNAPIDTGLGQLQEGQDYWLAVTPPIALKAIPRHFGEKGKTRIVFAMRARKRRRL